MSYVVRFARRAEKDLERLDKTIRARVFSRMEELSADPFDNRIGKPLKGTGVLRSSRIGGWRIIYSVHRETVEIEIVSIRPRGDAYRRM